MQFSDFSSGQIWAIRANKLEAMLQEIRAHMDGKMAMDAVRFTVDPSERSDFLLRDGVAVIPVTGPISKRGSFWSYLFGGTPLTVLQQVFVDALDDPDVQAILLDIDSPGGTVSGLDAFSDMVFAARGKKPVVSFANGQMASAAYWIGSPADYIVVESTAEVGSIGTALVHTDLSKQDEMMGRKRTVMTSGEFKALGNNYEPLSDMARVTLQADLDYVNGLFVSTVARNLGTDAETVLKNMADGRIFIGAQAVDAGLADAVGTMDTAISKALELAEASGTAGKTIFSYPNQQPGGNTMKLEDIKTQEQLASAFPELVAQIRTAAASGVDQDKIRADAATAERERVLGLVDIQFGAEVGNKFKAVVDTGVSVEQFKAISDASPKLEKPADGSETTAEALKAIQAAGAENPGAGGGHGQQPDFLALVETHMQQAQCTRVAAMQAVSQKHPEAHAAYLKSVNPSRA